MKTQIATFGLGCFWGAQDIFNKVKGVKKTLVGYMGGETENPSYEQVCTGLTGHTEVVQIEYDPKEVSYKELLQVFWKSHNPEIKTKEQYKSVVFYHNEKQKELAEKIKEPSFVTEILPASTFYKAEEYHQDYFKKNKVKTCHV